MEDNKRKLYDALSQEYDMGSFEQFSADIADENKRRKLYDATSEEYDYGDYETFSRQLGFGAEPSRSTQEMVQVEQKPPRDPQAIAEGRAMFQEYAEKRRAQKEEGLAKAEREAAERAAYAEKQGVSRYEDRPEPVEQQEPSRSAQVTEQVGQVEQSSPAMDPQERMALVENVAKAYEENKPIIDEYEARWKEYQADTDNDLSGPEQEAKKKWLDENNEAYRNAKNAISEAEGRLNLYDKPRDMERLREKRAEARKHKDPQQIIARGITPFGGDNTGKPSKEAREYSEYNVADDLYSMAEQTLNQGSKYDPGYEGGLADKLWTAVRQFGEGAANNFDKGSLTFGLSEGNALTTARKVGDKYNKIIGETIKKLGYSEEDISKLVESIENGGEGAEQYLSIMSAIEDAVDNSLSDGEKAILDALEEYLSAQMKRSQDVSVASAAGAGAEQSAEFMLDFILTGGLTKAGTKAAAKLASKRLMKKLGEKGAKAVSTVLSDAGVAAARTAIMFPRNLQSYGENLTQMTGKDELGRYNFDRSHLNAALNTALTQYIEYWSEGFGNYFSAGEQALFKGVTKAAPRTAIGKTLNQYRGSIGKYLDYGKFDGMFNEMLEEVVGSSFNALAGWMSGDRIGDKDAMKDFFSGEQLATLALSFLPMSVISARTNIKAYNKMKNRYNDGIKMLNPFIESGAVSREELEALTSTISEKTPEEIKDAIVDITDKARKANGGYLPEDFTQKLLGYVEGSFAMSMNNEAWENSQEKLGVVNAYEEQYANPDVSSAWELSQLETLARDAAIQAGFDENMLDLDSYAIARNAQAIRENNPQQADVLMGYAAAKAANQGLKDGYDEETRSIFDNYEKTVRENVDVNGSVITAIGPNDITVYISSKDVTVKPDGTLTTPTGADGLITYRLNPDSAPMQIKASALRSAMVQDLEVFLLDQEGYFFDNRQADFEQMQSTMPPMQAIEQRMGQTVYVEGNGAFEPVIIQRITNDGDVVISGDKEALKGIALAAGIASPGGQNLKLPVLSLYDMLSKEADGSLTTDQQEAVETEAPSTPSTLSTPSTEQEGGPQEAITYNGRPVKVDSIDSENGYVYYTYLDDKDGMQMVADLEDFKQQTGYDPAGSASEVRPVSEETVETEAPAEPETPVTETSVIPVDEKTGEPVYDAPGVTPEMAYDDIYSKLKEKNADAFVMEQFNAAEKALAKAQELVANGEQEKEAIDEWDKKPGEGLNAFLKRQNEAKAKVDERISDAQANLPELQRKVAFWSELRDVAQDNIAAREKEAERQNLIKKYGVDTSTFDLAPQSVEEAVAEYLGNGEDLIDLDDAKKEVFGKSGRIPAELFRHVGNGGILTKQGGRTIADAANDIVGEYENTLPVEQDAVRDLIIDYLTRYTKTEMREMIFNNRLNAALAELEHQNGAEEAAASEEVGDIPAAEEEQTPADEEIPAEEAVEEAPEGTEVPEVEEPITEPAEEGGVETAPESEGDTSESSEKSVSSQEEEAPIGPEAPRMLTEEEIRNSGFKDEDVIDAAVDYINGNHGFAETLAYNQIEEYVRSQRRTTEQTGGNADQTQLDGPVVQPAGVAAEQGGEQPGELGGNQETGTSERVPGPEDGGVPSGVRGAADAQGAGLSSNGNNTGSERRGGSNRAGQSGQSSNVRGRGSESAPVVGQPGEQGTATQTGSAGLGDAGREGNVDQGRSGAGVRGGQNEQGTQGLADAQPARAEIEAGSTDIEALGGELEDLLKQFSNTTPSIDRDINGLDSVSYSTDTSRDEEGRLSRKQPKRPTAPLSLEGMTPQQMQLAGKIIFSAAKLGYAYAKTEGLTTYNDFHRWFTAKFGDAVMKGLNYNESSLDAFIREVWNTKMKIDGERLTLEQHSQELHNEELREQSKKSNAERTRLQKEANEKKIPFKAANRKNIAEALPQLIPGQWDDVVAIERQFFDPSHNDYDHAYGKGMLITNGTGTGKTFTGLGVIKRFLDQGKGRILLVAPASMTGEWVDKAKIMGIPATKLANTKDKGKGVVVTSYENFRENRALYEDDFDLVVYDECQNIIENQKGEDTLAFEAHKRITNKNVEEAMDRLVATTQPGRRKYELQQENDRLEAERKKRSTKESRINDIIIRQREIDDEIQDLDRQIALLRPSFRQKAEDAVKKTKVLMLSATPFNTVQNLKFAEGYIFQFPKVFKSDGTEVTDEAARQSAFVSEWFRGDEPMEDLEIAFGDHLLDELETASYRELENGFDHSRDFPDVSGNVMASRFNAAWQALQKDPRFQPLRPFAGFLTDPTWTTQLFETMKVSAIRERLKQHLDAGRKIVIFHDRVHETQSTERRPAVGPPFATVLEQAMLASTQGQQTPVTAIAEFRAKFADVLKWEQTLDYRPVHEQVVDLYATDADRAAYEREVEEYNRKFAKWEQDVREFERRNPQMTPEELYEKMPRAPKRPQLKAESVAVYNGEKTNAEKDVAKAAFNDDNSKVKIICVTTRSGGAGLSLHDTTGKHPRVMIQTALPVSPIGFIQAEGRIFRWGNQSNAVFEYPRLGIDLEAFVFAMQFNAKAETVENLAHGFRGRGLKDSIMTGFWENSGNVPIDGQGIGGVEMDKRGNTLKGMAKAKHDYGVVQRKGVKEGDASIPEPVGFKMAEWAKAMSGDSALIPFAGRGSIARYIPKGVSTSALEDNVSLQSDLMVTSGGADFKIREGSFTELNMINKADVVLLNGATEQGGLDQIDTFKKGFGHLSEGGRLIAIIPDNAAANNAIAEITGNLGGALRMSIKINNDALDRGEGTSRIVVLDKISSPQLRATAGQTITHDFSSYLKEQVFDLLEKVNVPERIIDKEAIAIKKLNALGTEFRKNRFVEEFKISQYGSRFYITVNYRRKPNGFNNAKRSLDVIRRDGFYDRGSGRQYRLSDFENPNQYHQYIKAYQLIGEVLQMDDAEFRRFAMIDNNAKAEDVDALRELYRLYQKMVRAAFGLTDSQIRRVVQGMRPDVSASDIDTLNNYEELRAKFEAANHDDQERQDLYDRVAKVGEQLGLTIGAEAMDRDFLGGYNNVDNSLKVNKLRWNTISDDKRATTLLHEFIHSVTVYALAGYDSNAPGMSDALFNAAKLASDVFEQVQRGAAQDVRPFTGFYAIENAKEIMAEMANPEFREKLKNRRMWVVRSDRGIRVSGAEMEGAELTSAWALLNEALDGMLKNFDKSLFDRFRGRVSDFFWEVDREGKPTREADNGRADENTENNTNFVDNDRVRSIQKGNGESAQGDLGTVSGNFDGSGGGSLGGETAEAEREASARRLDVLQRGLAAERDKYLEESNRAGGGGADVADRDAGRDSGRKSASEAAAEELVRLAKENGFYIEPSGLNERFGEEFSKQGYESITFISNDGGVFTKLKNPFRLYSKFISPHTPFDVINEVIAHNIIFPNTEYRLLGVTELGGVRLVLQQDAVPHNVDAQRRQMNAWFAGRGFDFNQWSEVSADENVNISDADGKNAFITPGGRVRVIDPVIRFLAEPNEAIENLRRKLSGQADVDITAHSKNHPLMADITNAYERYEYESNDDNWLDKTEEFYNFLKDIRPKLDGATLGTIEDNVADEIDRLMASYPNLGKIAQYKDFFDYDAHGLYSVASAYVDKPVRREPGAVSTDEEANADNLLFREETDDDVLERLNSEPTIRVYRAMQLIDGNLYPPMSAKVDGKMREPIAIGKWERAEERPELSDENGNFVLNKGNGSSLKAKYNPYIHTSRTPLNDQFTSAYNRPNLVTVEVEVPESELSSGYKAEKAKDAVGEITWHSGPVSGKLPEGKKRKVILSRWDKPVRVLSDAETAERIAELLEGENIAIPYNVVTPGLRYELERRGVAISNAPSGTVERRVSSAELEATSATLDRMSDELGIKINRVSRSQMPRGHKTDKGYYNPATGEMALCMDNVTDERDAIATVLHETVGHHGLRQLFGDRFNDAMARIYNALDRKGKTWVNSYIVRHPNADNTVAVEEYLAHLAESGDFKNTVWGKIKEIIGRIVDALFGTNGFLLTDNELNYILRASYEHLKNPNWLDTMEGRAFDTLLKRQLGINETDPNKPTDPDGPGAGYLYRDGDTGVANDDYNLEMDSWENKMLTENQDADRPVRIGIDKVAKETGRDLKKDPLRDDEDYVTRHNLASSRAESEAHNFELFKFAPLMEQVRAIQSKLLNGKKGKDALSDAYQQILDYIYAVSGLERNSYKNAEIEKAKQDALADAAKAGVTDPAKLAEIEAKYEAMKKDWSGLTSLMGLPASQWKAAETQAQAMVDRFKIAVGDDAALDELWNRIRACTDFSLEHAYKYGLLTRDEFEKLHGTASQPRMWEYYVPLRGFNEMTAEEEFSYSNFVNPSRNSVVVKKMNGRWTQADNPLANILNIAETEIVQGNDNWAKQALYRFVLNSGENSLLSQAEPWYVKDPATGKWSMAEPYDGESLEDFEKRMRQNKALEPDNYKKGRKGLKLDNIMVNKAHRNEHAIHLKVGGVDRLIWVNGNPSLAKAVSGIGRAQNLQWLRRASRALSNLFTTYSLDFTAKNLIRDTIYSRVALLVKEDRAYRNQFRKNWYANLGYGAFAFPMIRLAAKWENGELQAKDPADRTKREQQFIDFMMDGGQTGYTIINSVSKIKKDLERAMRRSGGQPGVVRILEWFPNAVKTLNEAFELLTRFTAYETSRDMGRSGQRSASDAKEISVNFNRRGAQSGEGIWGNIAAYLGATHYFYNAGVQGFDNFLKLYKKAPVKMTAATVGLIAMGILTPMINSMLAGLNGGGDGDDDWYWNLPEWVRRNNLIFGTDKFYVAIPLPVEFRAPYGIGDIAGAAFAYDKYANRKGGLFPWANLAGDIITTASDILPVNPVEGYNSNGNIGDAIIRAVAPDAGMFFVDWATNRDYTGRPLWKENPFSDTVPRSQGAYASTPKGIVTASQKLAEVTNGAIDIPPGLIRDMMNNYGGGFYRFAEDISKGLFGLLGNDPERPFRWDNIPFFSGFTGHIDEDRSNSFANNALYDYKKLSEENVKDMNAMLGTDEVTSAILYDEPETLYEREGVTIVQKAKIKRMLDSKDYALGKMYREGMNNTYKMKQSTRDGHWYKSREIEKKGVNTLRQEWKDLLEKQGKGQATELEVQEAWHRYYDAQADLAERLLDLEYNR